MVEEQRLGECFSQREFAMENFGVTKILRYTVVMVNGEEGVVRNVWLANVFPSSRLM